MPFRTSLTERLGLAHPIIQAPMAGGGDTPALAAAVSEAGGLGSIGGAYMAPTQLAETLRAVRETTRRPFAANLFAPLPAPVAPKDYSADIARLAPYYAELGLPQPSPPVPQNYGFADQLGAVLDSGAAVFSFAFAPVSRDAIEAAKARGMTVFGTATTVAEAVVLVDLGVDGVVAQGSEAGGHRGSFAQPFEAAMIGTMALVPQVVDAVRVPVIASGASWTGAASPPPWRWERARCRWVPPSSPARRRGYPTLTSRRSSPPPHTRPASPVPSPVARPAASSIA